MTHPLVNTAVNVTIGICVGASIVLLSMRGHCELKAAKAETKAVMQVVVDERKSTGISDVVGAKTAKKVDAVRTRTLTLIQKVPVYVPVKNDDSDRIPVGLASLHDAAASGVSDIPVASGVSPEALSAFTKTDLAFAFAVNYGIAHECTETLTGLQDWTVKQHELSASRNP